MTVPPDFVAGSVLTAAQMNKIGLWLIKTETVGTAVSTVTVSSAFSADYENYRVIYSGGVGSTALFLRIQLGATATGYYYAGSGVAFNGAGANLNGDNATVWFVGHATSTAAIADFDVYRPFASDETLYRFNYVNTQTGASGAAAQGGGWVNSTTSYTAFTLTPSTGTITGGTIYVYGYRD